MKRTNTTEISAEQLSSANGATFTMTPVREGSLRNLQKLVKSHGMKALRKNKFSIAMTKAVQRDKRFVLKKSEKKCLHSSTKTCNPETVQMG